MVAFWRILYNDGPTPLESTVHTFGVLTGVAIIQLGTSIFDKKSTRSASDQYQYVGIWMVCAGVFSILHGVTSNWCFPPIVLFFLVNL